MLRPLTLLIFGLLASPALAAPTLAERLMRVDRSTVWVQSAAIPVAGPAYHPQGMVRIGPDAFVSAVEITAYPSRLAGAPGGRSAGTGVGHLLRIGPAGERLGDLTLGDGDAYHPGGIDFDGRDLWVPVAEYRPDSRAVIYRVDPVTLKATEVLRVADHIGAVTYDRKTRRLQGVSWGGRRFYTWKVSPAGRVSAPKVSVNPTSYIDYQDCHGLGGQQMLCSGLAEYRSPKGGGLSLGGLEIIDLRDHRPLWQAPVPLWAPSGRPMTQNPAFVETTAGGLRAWFMPDDDHATLYAYDVALPGN